LFPAREVNNYEPSDVNEVRNEMSSAADDFHPGFSPESSLMELLPAGLLACVASLHLPMSHVRHSGMKHRMFE